MGIGVCPAVASLPRPLCPSDISPAQRGKPGSLAALRDRGFARRSAGLRGDEWGLMKCRGYQIMETG